MRRFFSRLLLFVLAGVAVYAVVRFLNGPDDSDAPVALGDDLGVDDVAHDAFEVTRPARLAVHAVGSFETDSTFAATAWIVRRGDGAPVWRMDPRRVERGRGTLATLDDTLAFEPGVYDAYVATYGDPDLERAPAERSLVQRLTSIFGSDGRVWRGDEGRWRLRVAAADSAAEGAARPLDGDAADPAEALARTDGLVWTSGPIRSGDAAEQFFEVTAPVRLRIRSAGEVVDGEVRDGAAILPLIGRDTVWAMGPGAPWAGGVPRNRRADTTLALAPGFYRARYATDEAHAYRSWRGNPPFVPSDWGLTLTAADSAEAGRVVALDPWQRLPRIASFTCVGPDALREDTFTLSDTTDVLLLALGEIVGSTAYDYALLLQQQGGGAVERWTMGGEGGIEIEVSTFQSPVEVWTMGRDNTQHAGGADKNRRAEVALRLPPATYTLSYRTDDSHDCSDFNADEPPDPEHWGATLFALDPDFDPDRVVHTVSEPPADEEAAADLAADSADVVLAAFTRVGNNADVRAAFTLDKDATVRIYALGEILPSGRYDYAWITPEGETDEVWAMTRENTRWAGGSKKNRVFDGTLALEAGTYSVHYRTNATHAFGNWDQPAPTNPEAWGVLIWRPVSYVDHGDDG